MAKTEDARAAGSAAVRAGAGDQPSRADRAARGKDARALAPLESHAEFTLDRSRDPVGLLLEQAHSRVPELVPVRHGRMLVSPFTFYRGYARDDLEASRPTRFEAGPRPGGPLILSMPCAR